jgi:hypothetical protein
MKDNKFKRVIYGFCLASVIAFPLYYSYKTDRIHELADHQYIECRPNNFDCMVKYPTAGLTSGDTINGHFVF